MTPSLETVAHRGASGEAPENTLASVSLGWEQQANAVEVDVHLTRDGEVVVIHDPTLLRTTGRDARVEGLNLADIQKLDAGVWKDARWRGERVPSLAQVLATVPAGRRLFIEIKTAQGLVPALQRVVKAGPVEPGRIVLISFESAALREAKRALPGCPAFFLADTPEGEPGKLPGLIQFCLREDFDGLGVSAGWPVTAKLVEQLRAQGLELNVWTVNDARRARELAAAGVAGMWGCTSRPASSSEASESRSTPG